jgi:hypothetical protein
MANILSKTGIVSLATIRPWHVSQSVDAFTGLNNYDITISGSLTVTGSVYINSLITSSNVDVVTIDPITGQLFSTSSNSFNSITNITNSFSSSINTTNYFTSSISNSFSSSIVNNSFSSSVITNNNFTSSVNNNYFTSSVNNNYTNSIVNNIVNQPAPSDQFIQYNSGSTFGADSMFQYVYSSQSLQQGLSTLAIGINSHAEGDNTIASGSYSHTEGRGTQAKGNSSHAEGRSATSIGFASHAEGFSTIASGSYSHAEGFSTIAFGASSHAEGNQTSSSGDYSHAEGDGNESIGTGSHAEGSRTTSTGNYSHAEGLNTISTGFASHAEGESTTSAGNYSHAEGSSTYALGTGSHAEGYSTVAIGDYQHVSGVHNLFISDPTANRGAFIIGNGTPLISSNILFASGSNFQISASLNLSGSFVPQFRYLGSVQVPGVAPGKQTYSTDYNVTFQAGVVGMGNKNEIILPISPQTGSIIYLQRISGTSACRVSGSGAHTVNGSAGYTFPTSLYARRMFVFHGTGWYTEPNPIA